MKIRAASTVTAKQIYSHDVTPAQYYSYAGVTKSFLVNLRECVESYCPTTHTECHSFTRARQWDLLYL